MLRHTTRDTIESEKRNYWRPAGWVLYRESMKNAIAYFPYKNMDSPSCNADQYFLSNLHVTNIPSWSSEINLTLPILMEIPEQLKGGGQ